MSEFYEGLAEILEVEVDEITPDLNLEDGGWDSLAVVSTIALIDDVYDVTVHPTALSDCKTVGDIEKLVATERGTDGED
ncbi:MAG TPA: acyl carrier protein [Allosphingosinicella sp.]|jgi:acyl carrier protein